ncbi:MAG TPA: DUF5667 domain-containing protein [Bacillus sp. (in: firmicutes)]|nr:DUF5667 domain-containing protein [Bacillus sp. (in: firmicutes)]
MDWKKYFKQTSAAMVAGTMIFSSSAALANEESVSLNQVNEQEEVTTADPGLTPGNFFYFLDKFFENVSLLLTFDDTEKVQKYAEYASEKIAEAEELFNAGDEELAIETLNNALEYMSQAEEDAANEEETDESTEDQENTEEGTDETEGTEDDASDVTEDEATDEATEEASEDQVLQVTLEDLQTQNIIALTHALENVKNPTARAALERNIEKTYAKIIKKLEKLGFEVELVEEETEETANTDETATTDETTEETNVTEEAAEETTEATETAVEEESTETDESVTEEKVESPAVNKAKEEKKAAKEEAKEVKQEAKEEKKAAKEEVKQEKKEEAKQGKENDKANGNGQGNGKGPNN